MVHDKAPGRQGQIDIYVPTLTSTLKSKQILNLKFTDQSLSAVYVSLKSLVTDCLRQNKTSSIDNNVWSSC